MFRISRFLLAASTLLAVAACKHHPPPPPPPPFVVTVVTTLPFDNASASIDAPKILRAQLHPRIQRKGYVLQPMGDTDSKLNGMGIQLGGQIKGVDPKELREKLGADLVVWGTVYESSSLVTGVYNSRKVDAEIIVTDLRTGEVIWKDRQRIATDDQNFGAKKGIDFLAGAVQGVVKADMTKEHILMADTLVNRMPWCPRQAPPPPPPPVEPAAAAAPAPSK
jgi:hypothetical protein